MSLEAIVQLSHSGFVQLLIGHPTDYGSKHFEQLLELKPPSIWARGLGLLRALGMEEKLEQARIDLPLRQITSLAWVRRRWRRHFPRASEAQLTENILREISTQYADLWVFGLGDMAKGLAQLRNPSKIAQGLFLANEVRTYPVLFGLGGTAHYDSAKLSEPSLLSSLVSGQRPPRVIVPSELQILMKGIGIDADRLSARDIIEFHGSGCGRHLRLAMSSFSAEAHGLVTANEETSLDRVFSAAAKLQDKILDANRVLADPVFRKSARSTRERVHWLLRAGGLALGAGVASLLGADWLAMLGPSGVGAAVVDKLVPEGLRQKIITTSIAQQFSPAIAHLWRIVETRGERSNE
jgi:hypothetical protein